MTRTENKSNKVRTNYNTKYKVRTENKDRIHSIRGATIQNPVITSTSSVFIIYWEYEHALQQSQQLFHDLSIPQMDHKSCFFGSCFGGFYQSQNDILNT